MIDLVRDLLTRHSPVKSDPRINPPYRAAVLVPLVCVEDTVSVILIHRTEDMGPHSGQMGFPGGMSESTDSGDLSFTALRETSEELGIDTSRIELAGRLSELITWTSEILVRPYVGLLPELPRFVPDPVEVQSVHVARLQEMLASVMEEDNPFGLPGKVYPVDDKPVWGLTARIITELLEVLGDSVLGMCDS